MRCVTSACNLQFETFKKLHGEDQMAVDKLKEGIDGFAKDQVKLEAMVHEITEGGEFCRGMPLCLKFVSSEASAPVLVVRN